MKKYFEKDRYDFSGLIEIIKNMPDIPNTLPYDDEVSIEIYGGDKLAKTDLIHILEDFSILDNLVQSESQDEFERSKFDIKDFQFIPDWLDVSNEKVVIGYCGEYVNTSFEKTFTKENGLWRMN